MRLFRKKKLTDIYQKYNSKNVTYGINIFDSIPNGKNAYKTQILELFEEAIRNSDSEKLSFCIGVSSRDGIDSDYLDFFERVILVDWHEEHEDIVDIIYQFKDDRFSESLKEIALNKSKYRKFDLESESALRKCIHALKGIDSEKSKRILEELKATKNPNVKYALEMYSE